MQVVNTGNTYKIYDDSMKTYNQLPPQAYTVCFSKMSGFFLSKYDDIEVNEKVYGVHLSKVGKVLGSFADFNRNLGVILSGDKGIGKSLFAKLLAVGAVKNGYPVVIVNTYIPGIADYLGSIQQEVMVLFDEFDKTFNAKGSSDSMSDPQSEMLTLFDGLAQGKKLFVLTCNELRNLNGYLVNRPGRFHYHFRFEYPSADEIRQYLVDKLPESAYGEIPKVITFSRKVELNFDCLRAIAFELGRGLTFEQAIGDLNIVNLSREYFSVTLYFKDGGRVRGDQLFDMFSDEEICVEFRDEQGYDFYVSFDPHRAIYDNRTGDMVLSGQDAKLDWQEEYYNRDEDDKKRLEQRKLRQLESMHVRRKASKGIHYRV